MDANHAIIVAVVGVNHTGDLGMAKAIVSIGAEALIGYMKLQAFSADKTSDPNAVV